MRLAKIDTKKFILIILFTLFFFLSRLLFLDQDGINPDAVNWHYRSEQFVVGLKHSQFFKTYQHYHPGVTLMWITGIPIELVKQISGEEVYTHENFMLFHLTAKFALILVQYILSLVTIYFLTKIIKFKPAFFTVAIFLFEPFIIGNSRLYHMDLLFTQLLFLLLIFAYLSLTTKKMFYILSTGIIGGFLFLTRSLGIGGVLYALGTFFVFSLFLKESFITVIKKWTFMLLIFIGTTFVFFPALWSSPTSVLTDIFSEGERVGVRKGHTQIFYGEETNDPGFGFYPLVLSIKTSPFLLLGVIMYLYTVIRLILNRNFLKDIGFQNRTQMIGFFGYITIFYFGYFLVMSYPTKKLDRYMIPLFPYLSFLGALGFSALYKIAKGKNTQTVYYSVMGIVYFSLVGYFVIRMPQYLFTYTSPIFGDSSVANNIIGQKPFGVGINLVENKLSREFSSNGDLIDVGMIDTKPLKAIYPNSLVHDVRIDGTSGYDIIVLAINEEMPENVLNSGTTYEYSDSIVINGLNYYDFYIKKDR